MTAEEAFDLVTTFYPDRLIEPKTRFGLEEIFEKLNHTEEPDKS